MGRTRRLRVLEGAEHEGEVEALGGEVDAAVGEAEADVDLGVEVLEGGDERGDQALADAEGGGDVQRAARVLRDVGDGGLGLGDGVEDLLRARVEDARPARSAAGCGWCG